MITVFVDFFPLPVFMSFHCPCIYLFGISIVVIIPSLPAAFLYASLFLVFFPLFFLSVPHFSHLLTFSSIPAYSPSCLVSSFYLPPRAFFSSHPLLFFSIFLLSFSPPPPPTYLLLIVPLLLLLLLPNTRGPARNVPSSLHTQMAAGDIITPPYGPSLTCRH